MVQVTAPPSVTVTHSRLLGSRRPARVWYVVAPSCWRSGNAHPARQLCASHSVWRVSGADDTVRGFGEALDWILRLPFRHAHRGEARSLAVCPGGHGVLAFNSPAGLRPLSVAGHHGRNVMVWMVGSHIWRVLPVLGASNVTAIVPSERVVVWEWRWRTPFFFKIPRMLRRCHERLGGHCQRGALHMRDQVVLAWGLARHDSQEH
mmetsp:Transcript_36041/g.95706  ORF Transcript_36041/g.95706 Transcript_36041/m.95706 type:complete len:205 (-) Transcript_36041:48-662(-)